MDESERRAQGAEGVWQARSKEESGDRKERAWLESVGLIACVTHLLHLLCVLADLKRAKQHGPTCQRGKQQRPQGAQQSAAAGPEGTLLRDSVCC